MDQEGRNILYVFLGLQEADYIFIDEDGAHRGPGCNDSSLLASTL